MRDFGSYYRDPFDTEEVEVLQGPSSVTFGRGSTGGVVNQETKVPRLGRVLSGDAVLGTDHTRRLTVDFNTPLPDLGSGTAFRLNVMGNLSGVAGRDVAESRRFGIAPALAWGLDGSTRWTLTGLHQSARDVPDYGLPWLFADPAPVTRESWYGFATDNTLDTDADIATLRTDHAFEGGVRVRNQLRWARYRRDALVTEPQIVSPSLSVPFESLRVNRRQIDTNSTETLFTSSSTSASKPRREPSPTPWWPPWRRPARRPTPERANWSGVPATSLLHPVSNDAFAGTRTVATRVDALAWSVSASVLDTVKIGSEVELSAGARFDRFSADYDQSVAPVSAFQRVDRLWTWRAAAVWKPTPAGSVYVAAGTSLNPSAEALSLTVANADLAPEKNETWEAGTSGTCRTSDSPSGLPSSAPRRRTPASPIPGIRP
jgi:catecholate siderophore receptor